MESVLLNELGAKLNGVLSDLRMEQNASYCRTILLQIPDDRFSVKEWNYALGYIYDAELSFATVKQAKDWIVQHDKLPLDR